MTVVTDPTRFRRRPLGGYRYTRLRWRILFAAIDALGACWIALCQAVRGMIDPGRWRQAPKVAEDPQRILLIQLDHLGDAILTTVVLPPLRRRYPKAAIDVLASPWNCAVFEACAEVDRVHRCRVNRFARGRRWGWIPATIVWGFALRKYRYDLGIDVRGEFPLALLLRLSGARRRLGWNCGGGGFLLTDSPTFVPDRPEVDSRLALLDRLGIRPAPGDPPWRPTFPVSPTARANAARRWTEGAVDLGATGPRIVLHIGAGTPAKRWPAEHWRELLGRLICQFAAQIMLVGGEEDRIIAGHILGRAGWPRVVDATGQLSIMELAGVLQQADLMVGADSGPAHLAAAVGTPLVALFSGTNSSGQWQPCGTQVTVLRHPVSCSPCHCQHCPRANHPCMQGLRPEAVVEVIGRIQGPRLRAQDLTVGGLEPERLAVERSPSG